MRIKIGYLLLCLTFLLGGCGYGGVTGSSSQAPSPSSDTPGPGQATPAPDATTATKGALVQVSATTYQPQETMVVTISNFTSSTIVFTDHQTNCTVVLLQHQTGAAWENFAPCRRMTATRRQTLETGKHLTISLNTGGASRPTGNYRIAFRYSQQASGASEPSIIVYSPLFQVASK